MKRGELCHHKCWGFLLSAFGVFFLIANLVPSHGILCYWPVFLIAAGVLKAYCGCISHCKK
jgi:thiosulfate reductase cytochrome b subunit